MEDFQPAGTLEPDETYKSLISEKTLLLAELDKHDKYDSMNNIPKHIKNGKVSPTKASFTPHLRVPTDTDYLDSGVSDSGWNTNIAVYLRVSSTGQHPSNQMPAIIRFIENKFPMFQKDANGARPFDLYWDHESGRHTSRESWSKLFNKVQREKYQHVIAWSVDRVSRDCGQFCTIINMFQTHGCHLHFVQNHISTDSHMGMFMSKFFALFGEFEAVMLDERRTAGIARARAAGVHMGRLPDVEHDVEIFEMVYANQDISQRAVATHFKKSRAWAKAAIARVKLDMVGKDPVKIS